MGRDFCGASRRKLCSLGCSMFTLVSPRDVPIWRDFNKLAQSHNWTVRELSDNPLTLEETFLSLTESKNRPRKQGESAA